MAVPPPHVLIGSTLSNKATLPGSTLKYKWFSAALKVNAKESLAMNGDKKRRIFKWSMQARELVRTELAKSQQEHRPVKIGELVTALTEHSGNPRAACFRFARQMGIEQKREYRPWSEKEQQQLLYLLESQTVRVISSRMKRSRFAIYAMLHRLGVSAIIGKDGFSKYLLANLLHCRPETIQRWVDQGLLAAQVEQGTSLRRTVVASSDFEKFCKTHPEELLRRRIRSDRLEFIFRFVFPRNHVDLLPVRSAKKERAAYERQVLAEKAVADTGSQRLQSSSGSPEHSETAA